MLCGKSYLKFYLDVLAKGTNKDLKLSLQHLCVCESLGGESEKEGHFSALPHLVEDCGCPAASTMVISTSGYCIAWLQV